MSSDSTKQFASATNMLLASQVSAFRALGDKTTEGVEKTMALNFAASKASMANSVAMAKQLSTAKDPQAFFSLTAAQATPAAEAMAAYSRDLTEIAVGMWAEFMSATETPFAQSQGQASGLAANTAKNSQAGSD